MNWLFHPQLVLCAITLGKKYNTQSINLDSLKGKTKEAQLITTNGKIIKGTGIDLNNDGAIDAFWYSDIFHLDAPDGIFDSMSRLYLKIDGEWVFINYRNLSEQEGSGLYES
jgi:predicted Abi (CAAX) family protease